MVFVIEGILIEGWIQVILAGEKEYVSLAIENAERFQTELLRRCVLLVLIIWGEGRTLQVEKKGFGVSPKAVAALPSIGVKYRCTCPVMPYIHRVAVL
ncbi:hypothetical protein CRYUN_Cryun14cG0088600 [Craigia yunnanensis]